MRSIIILTALSIILIVLSCKKPKQDDLSGEVELKGSVFLHDTLTGKATEVVLKDHPIQIKELTDSATQSYLMQVKTNAQGSFTFTNLSAKEYVLYSEKEIDGILYTFQSVMNPSNILSNIKVVLYPSPQKNNILAIENRDNATNGLLNKAKICFFKSSLLARNNQCEGALFEKESNENGKVVLSKLEPGWYYINAQYTNGSVNLKARDSILVGENGLHQRLLLLKPESIGTEIDGIVYYNDTLNGFPQEKILPQQTLLLKKLEDSLSQNILQTIKTNDQGKFVIPNLAATNYYLYSEKEINGVLFLFKRIINPSIDKNLKVVLYPDASTYNIVTFTTRDSITNGILSGAQFCLFNNSLVAKANECEGAILNGITNSFGKFTTTQLPEGWYYINAKYSVGNVSLKTHDSVYVSPTGIVKKQLNLK